MRCRSARACSKKCSGNLIARKIKPRPGRSSCWSVPYAEPVCHPSGQPRLDASCRRKATACNATAPGVTQATRYANAKMGSTVCAMLMPRKKNLIERAYQLAEACGLPLWNQDEAGPYATRPQPGASWQLEGHPHLQPHEYLRDGGAKLMTLFRPASGEVRAKGVISVTNAVLHPWLKEQLLAALEAEDKAKAKAAKEEGAPAHTPAELAEAREWKTWVG